MMTTEQLPSPIQRPADAMWYERAPHIGAHLPGGGCELHIIGLNYPITLDRTVGLHAMLSYLLGTAHQQTPDFSLVPWPNPCGWAVLFCTQAGVDSVAGRTFEERSIYGQPVTVRFGNVIRLKSPTVDRVGPRQVVIDTITPVTVRSMGSTVARAEATAESIVSSLTRNLARRLGMTHIRQSAQTSQWDAFAGLDAYQLPLRVVHASTVTSRMSRGKQGVVTGWEGRVIVETSAVGEWLLRVAALGYGLGGRTAFGYGRVRVSSIEEDWRAGVATGRWFIGPHAVRRFQEHTRFTADYDRALSAVIAEAQQAHYVKKLDSGADLWRGPPPHRLRYIVGPGHGPKPAVLTILPSHDGGRRRGVE